jgi:hypothetical protein
MVNTISRPWLAGGVWFATLAVILASSVALNARLSTSALLLVAGLIPAIVVVLIGAGAPSPTVAEILHAVTTQDRGR